MIRYFAGDSINPKIGGSYQFIANLKSAADMHDHDFYEFFLVTKGRVHHNVNTKIQNLHEGSLVFIRPTDCHSYDKNSNTDCQFINIIFNKATLEKIIDFFDNEFSMEELLYSHMPPVRNLSTGEKVILQDKLEELNAIHQCDTKLLKIKLRSILIEIFTRYFGGLYFKKIERTGPEWLEYLYEQMQRTDHFREGLPCMERISGKSREHISRCFVKYFKITPAHYVNRLRLNYAANLLCNSDLEIIDICFDAGFQNLSHFYHLFKLRYEISPAKFKNRTRACFKC